VSTNGPVAQWKSIGLRNRGLGVRISPGLPIEIQRLMIDKGNAKTMSLTKNCKRLKIFIHKSLRGICSFLQLCIVKSKTMSNCRHIYHLTFSIEAAPAVIWRGMGNVYGKESAKDFNHYGSSMR
jgi:hypothetical protein